MVVSGGGAFSHERGNPVWVEVCGSALVVVENGATGVPREFEVEFRG